MNGTERGILPEDRRRKSDEAQQFSEDRMQLLDTIRDMIDIELERLGVMSEGDPHPVNLPPEHAGLKPPDRKLPCRTLWQRIVKFFKL